MLDFLRNDVWKAVARKKYAEDIRTVIVSNGTYDLFYLVYDEKNPESVDWNFFKAKMWQTRPSETCMVNQHFNPVLPVFVTRDFWTCGCGVHFLNHQCFRQCPICKHTADKDSGKYELIETLTEWRLS